MTKQAVGQNVKQIKLLEDALLSDFYDKHKPVEEICRYYGLDEPLPIIPSDGTVRVPNFWSSGERRL